MPEVETAAHDATDDVAADSSSSTAGDLLRRAWRPYVRDVIYAANDGIITTFAVIAGSQGATLSGTVVLALGFANLAADGLAMGMGNYLGEKSEAAASAREQGLGFAELHATRAAAKHGAVTWASFVVAGFIPLIPYLVISAGTNSFALSAVIAAVLLFTIGAGHVFVTGRRWWVGGLEMLLVGGIAGTAAFLAGYLVERAVNGG